MYTEVRPEEYRGWYWLAQAQLYRKDFDSARTSITRAIALNGGSAEAYRTLGQVELERKDYNAAYTAWIKANQLNPADSKVTYYSDGYSTKPSSFRKLPPGCARHYG